MPIEFEVKERAASGRLGRLVTPHGTVTTPALLPVVNPRVPTIPVARMRELGAEMLITNAYILRQDPALRDRALSEGVHKVLDWDGPLMTDSGTFQSYRYGSVDVAPAEIVAFERDIGTDVGTILDVFSTPERTREEALADLETTVARAKESHAVKGGMALAATVQGGVHPELRERAARAIAPYADVAPIGGVVPLMEQQRYEELTRVILAAQRGLPPSRPVHLFGCGHPHLFALAAALGCDLFDSSSYAKYAREGRMILPWGTRHVAELEELPCACPVCAGHTAKELAADPAALAEHNLRTLLAEVARVRQAIRDGLLWELVEERAAASPHLQGALHVLEERQVKDQLELSEPIVGGRALFYTGPHTVHRPLLYRLHKRLLSRYEPPAAEDFVLFPESERPYGTTLAARCLRAAHGRGRVHFVVNGHLGPAPLELDEMYPFAQTVTPTRVDSSTRYFVKEVLALFTDHVLHGNVLEEDETLPLGNHDSLVAEESEVMEGGYDPFQGPPVEDPAALRKRLPEGAGPFPGDEAWDVLRVKAVADVQLGSGAGAALTSGRVEFRRSDSTGKVRNVFRDGRHIASLRASEGLLSLTLDGARLLLETMPPPRLRAVVNADAAPFNREGRNVMAPFVVEMDPDLRPGDECIVVDEGDGLLAVGRVLLTAREAPHFTKGVAVRVRDSVASGAPAREG